MSDQLLDQADALMRRRSFVAGAKAVTAPSDIEPPATEEAIDQDVLAAFPVLTEVIAEAEVAAEAPPLPARPDTLAVEALVEQRMREHQAQVNGEIEAWLDEHLPRLVNSAMDGITDYLVSELREHARAELLPRLQATLQSADATTIESESTSASRPSAPV